MISLYKYLFEAAFVVRNSKNEWSHGGYYDYPIMLIDDMISSNRVLLGKRGEKNIELKLSQDDINELKDIQTHVKDENALTRFNELTNKFGFKFTDVYKGKFSGYTGGQSTGEIYESLVCYLFNNPSANIDDWIKRFNAIKSEFWINNSKKSAQIIRVFMNNKYHNSNDYVALHINAKNYDTFDDVMLNIAKIFTGKTGLSKIIDKTNVSDFYDGRYKDKWNPADIVLLKKDTNALKKVLDEIIIGNSGTTTNNILVRELGNGLIIPISLKAIDERNAKIYGHNIADAEFMDKHEIKLTYIQLGQDYTSHSKTGSFYDIGITENGVNARIQIRAQAKENDNISVEVHTQSGKARGGKGLEVIKRALDLSDNSYYHEFSNNDELFKEFKKYGFLDKNGYKIVECPQNLENVDLYNRTCYKGFFGLLEKFQKEVKQNPKLNSKYGEGDNLLLNFTKFLWDACTDCPGSYYILK